ncbi:MAG: TonB family protein [bacterium]
MSRVAIEREWIRGAYRVETPTTAKRGFVAALVVHALACAVVLATGAGGLDAPGKLAREDATPVVVELPRIEPEARIAARIETPEPPAPGPVALPARVEAPPTAAPAPARAVREAPAPVVVAEVSAEDARAAQAALAEAAAARAQAARDAEASAARAKVSESLAGITSSLDDVLGGLASATETRTTSSAPSSRSTASARGASVRSARTGDEIGAMPAAAHSASGGAGAGSAPLLASAELAPVGGGGEAGSRGRGVRGGSAGGAIWDGVAGEGVATGDRIALASDARSNASLLAVIRRYATGIQFCYENELAKSGGLGGRLVVSMTVAPGGEVTDAKIMQDTVGSPVLATCVLTQVRGWKFPAIPEGSVTFKTPFLFTPPS